MEEGGRMPDILVRNLTAQTVKKLKKRATRHGRSLQAEVKAILEGSAAEKDNEELYWEAVEFSKRFEGRNLGDSAELIREDRER
jgi:plasmid stability protein